MPCTLEFEQNKEGKPKFGWKIKFTIEDELTKNRLIIKKSDKKKKEQFLYLQNVRVATCFEKEEECSFECPENTQVEEGTCKTGDDYYYNEKTGTNEHKNRLILFTGCNYTGDFLTVNVNLANLRKHDLNSVRSVFVPRGFDFNKYDNKVFMYTLKDFAGK